jgi:hypothetical protein
VARTAASGCVTAKRPSFFGENEAKAMEPELHSTEAVADGRLIVLTRAARSEADTG